MNVNAIKYGRIKRQAPDRVFVSKQQITDALMELTKGPLPEIRQEPTALDMAQKVWNARHK